MQLFAALSSTEILYQFQNETSQLAQKSRTFIREYCLQVLFPPSQRADFWPTFCLLTFRHGRKYDQICRALGQLRDTCCELWAAAAEERNFQTGLRQKLL